MIARSCIALATVLLLVIASSVALGSTASAGSPAQSSATGIARAAGAPATPGAAGRDYATDTFADPWDYSNGDDLLLDDGGPAMKVSGASISAGAARMRFVDNGYISPLWGGYNNRMLLPRDGNKRGNAVQSARYRTVSFQAWSSRQVDAGFFWFTCPVDSRCEGGIPFRLYAGWHTYVLHPGASGFGLPVNWGGALTGIRMAVSPGAAGTDFALDWLRLSEPNSGAAFTFSNPAGGAAEVIWDGDSNPSNNLSSASNWGVLQPISGTSGLVDLSALPAGTYRIGVRRSGTVATWTSVSLAAPLPRFITPNAVGDKDYAATVLKNPWDMNGGDDISRIGNARSVSYSGSTLAATNTSNDPFANLRLGSGGIDTRIYRNLTITSHYDGRFNLADTSGGGTMARVVWQRADGGTGQTSDILTYGGTRTLSFDMGLPDDQIVEASVRNASFLSASRLTSLRWDANEDRGPRRWYLHDVQLRSDFGTAGTFPITWQDAAYQPGGTATLIADTDRAGCNGVTVASGVTVQQGTNTTAWNTAGTAKGRYWLCLRITRGKAVTSGYAGGVLVVGTNPPGYIAPSGNPTGHWDSGTLSGGSYRVAGWAYDPSALQQAIHVDAYDTRPNGTRAGTRLTTGTPRPDVARIHPSAGPSTGFAATLRLAGPGRHTVCLYAVNVGAGASQSLGCRPVDVGGQTGHLDSVAGTGVQTLRVNGWAADPSAPTTPQNLTFTVTGPAGTRSGTGSTAMARPDVARAVPWVGPNSGFSATVPAAGLGQNTVCAAIVTASPPAPNRSLGCRTVTVS